MSPEEPETETGFQPHPSKIVRFYAHPWTQILLISFICFCMPGVRFAFCVFFRDTGIQD